MLSACGSFNRVEKDVHTITEMDTLVVDQVRNQPNDRDNGVIYPSSRTVTMERNMLQHDSVVEREYPNFIRLAAFEGIGTIGSQLTGNSTQMGLFGVFPDVDQFLFGDETSDSGGKVFSGGIYRFGIGEWRLPMFGDDPNWTYGITGMEIIQPDDDAANELLAFGTISIRKRFYFLDKIPYLAIVPGLHVGFAPSFFLHGNVSADVGSMSGVNFRVVAGYVYGQTSLFSGAGRAVNFPYVGFGVGMADFLNREEELEAEWKDHEHSGWEIGGLDAYVIMSNADSSFWTRKDPQTGTKSPFTGLGASVLNAKISVPILDYRLYVGTSLLSLFILGTNEYVLGAVPIRVGYFFQPNQGRFVVEPFVEAAFAPSRYLQAGLRAGLPLGNQLTLQIQGGYISGSTGSAQNYSLTGQKNKSDSFNALYVGVGLRLFDKIFGRGELRYGRNLPHE
jgi:hypothetical protein